MTHAVSLGLQVLLGVLVRLYFGRHAFCDGDSGIFERGNLLGIVRDQLNGLNTEVLQNPDGKRVLAVVGVRAEARKSRRPSPGRQHLRACRLRRSPGSRRCGTVPSE